MCRLPLTRAKAKKSRANLFIFAPHSGPSLRFPAFLFLRYAPNFVEPVL